MAVQPARKGLYALFLRGWNEIPEVIGSSGMALIGIGLSAFGVMNYYRKNGDNRRYKSTYVVMRSSDPRASFVRKD